MTDRTVDLIAALADRYRIERELGSGGMATVYLAEDFRHQRRVAVKVLKPELAAVVGADRFLKEITTTAALRHPHILPLFDSGEAGGFLYYVMPYVRGESLRERLDREGQLGVDEAVGIACDIAEALGHAHREGVVHRDVKPENILLQDGRPVIADFGVALAVQAAAGDRLTETGLAVGTPKYMSPEQVSAEREVTGRSDIYALGAVLYEMLAGEPPHTGANTRAVVMKILSEDPAPLETVRRTVPDHVAAATAKALEKLPADRFATASDFAAAARGEVVVSRTRSTSQLRPLVARPPLARRMPLLAAVAVVAGVVGWAVGPRPAPLQPTVTRFTIEVPTGLAMYMTPDFAISPDGRTVVYLAADTLFARRLDATDPEVLAVLPGECCPEFTADGEWIHLDRNAVGDPRGVSVDGGPMVDLTAQLSRQDVVTGHWRGDGILLGRAGEEPTAVTDPTSREDVGAHLWPQLLPGGRHVLYTEFGPSIMWNSARVLVKDLSTGEEVPVADRGTYARYLSTGHVVYVDEEGTLLGVPFDLGSLRVTGQPMVLESGVKVAFWGGGAAFAVSESGNLVFARGSSLGDHVLTWLDREGRVVEVVGRPSSVEGVRLSQDGRFATTYVASPTSDVGVFDLATGEQRRLTFGPETEDNPVWSADGERIAYHQVVRGSEHRIYDVAASGDGEPRLLATLSDYPAPRSYSPDGRWLLYWAASRLEVVDTRDGAIDTLVVGVGEEGGRFSPDGRWIAYVTEESGRPEVYVASWPGMTSRRQVSRDGGQFPEWSRESAELFFAKEDTLMVTRVTTGDAFDHSPPRPLFASEVFRSRSLWYAVSADGERVLVAAANPDARPRELEVVVNWFEELRSR